MFTKIVFVINFNLKQVFKTQCVSGWHINIDK